MARMARIVVPGVPHQLTQRGNRQQTTFFRNEDYLSYLTLIDQWCNYHDVNILAYCLMPNHVHMVIVPGTQDGLRLAIGESHRRYTRQVNHREGWCGHLWQGRFRSFPMDERYLLSVIRYIELNPVRAGLVDRPEMYPWSSAASHLSQQQTNPPLSDSSCNVLSDWAQFLSENVPEEEITMYRRHERTGRPLGDKEFVEQINKIRGNLIRPKKYSLRGKAKHHAKQSDVLL